MKAVLFDLFETLISHFDPDWRPPARTIAQRLGVEEALFARQWGAIDKLWQAGAIPTYPEALAELCRGAGVTADPAVVDELTQEYRALTAHAYTTENAEIRAVLKGLRAAGVKLAIVSNASDLDLEPWDGHALAGEFDAFVVSHRVGLMKPDPQIYRLACEQLGVDPSHAVFVGDGGSQELRGAHEAGLEPVWCSWFLDRWPEGIRPNGFPGGEWRQSATRASESPYRRLAQPRELLRLVTR